MNVFKMFVLILYFLEPSKSLNNYFWDPPIYYIAAAAFLFCRIFISPLFWLLFALNYFFKQLCFIAQIL